MSRLFELQEEMLDDVDRKAMIDLIISRKQLTMSSNVEEFERQFALYLNVPFAVMVNSGSSANLLALAAISNPLFTESVPQGSEVLIPAICWATSLWPIVQMGLKPVWVDVNPYDFQINLDDMRSKINENTSAVLFVHILGMSTNMDEAMEICSNHSLVVIEDTCESLGSKFNGRTLGSFGSFGTFSFYYSHHITTIEGGMVICNRQEDVDLLKCLRSHGWTRYLSNKDTLEKTHANIDPRFLFVNMGYNLRPTELQGVLGISQLMKLDRYNDTRKKNYENLYRILDEKNINGMISFVTKRDGLDCAWFAFPIMINFLYKDLLSNYKEFLTFKGIENRPIISGNFNRQPALELYGIKSDDNLYGADYVHDCGLYIGIPCGRVWSDEELNYLSDTLLDKEFLQ